MVQFLNPQTLRSILDKADKVLTPPGWTRPAGTQVCVAGVAVRGRLNAEILPLMPL